MTAPWDQRPTDEHARVAALTLSGWLPAVLAVSPYHRRRHGERDERALGDLAGLRRLTPTRERDLLADSPAGASAVLRPDAAQVKRFAGSDTLGGIARAIRTRGSDGARDAILEAYRPVQLHRGGADGELLVASSRHDLDRLHRAGARAAAVLGLGDADVVVSAVPAGPTLASFGSVHLAYGAGLTALHARGADDDLAAVVRGADLLGATVLVVPLEGAVALAAALADARVAADRVHTVVTSGPPPDDETRARIADAFRAALGRDVRVRALWGPSAGRSLWAECAEGTHGLHTTPDLEVLEVLDPLTGAPTDGDGDLTITSIGWHGTAHVRFQTGTWVDPPTTEPCPGCARTVPRLVGDVVPHAWELPADVGDGATATVDLRGVAAVLADVPGVERWRAELRGPSDRVARDRLLVEVAGRPPAAQLDGLAARIGRAVGLEPQVLPDIPAAEIDLAVAELGGVLADRR